MDNEKPCYTENIEEIKWSSVLIHGKFVRCLQTVGNMFYPDINVKFLFYC